MTRRIHIRKLLAYSLIMAITATLFTGCGKAATTSEPAESGPAEAASSDDSTTVETPTEEPTDDAASTDAEAENVHSATDGLVITNNEMFDGKRKGPECDTLYATLQNVEIWGQEELDYYIQPEGQFLKRFIVKNMNSSPVYFRMDTPQNSDIVGPLSSITNYQFAVHPNGWDGYMEAGEERTINLDVCPENVSDESNVSGPLEMHLKVSVSTDNDRPQTTNFIVKQNVTFYGNEEFTDPSTYRGTITSVIKDEDGNPIKGAVIRGAVEYSPRRMYALSDENGEFSLKVQAYKTVYANAWKECQLCVKKDGYNARQIIVYPKVDETVTVEMTLFPENQLLKYEENGVVDLKLQGYENDTDGESTIAFVPFHTGQKSSIIKDRIQVTATDFDGNLLFEYPISEEQPYVQVSKDGKYVVTNINSSDDVTRSSGWKTVILDRDGNEVYSIDQYPVEAKENWPSESEANNSISRCAGISNTGKYLVASNCIGNFWVVDWQNNNVLWQDYIYGQVRTVDFSEDDSLLYISSGDGYYRCYTIDGKLVWKTFVDTWATKVRLTDDSIAILTKCGSDCLKVLDRETGKIRWTYPAMQSSMSMDVSPDGKYLWYGGHTSSGFSVIANSVFDMETGQIIYSLGCENAVAGAFSADGTKLVVSDRHGVYVYNSSDGSYLWSKTIVEDRDPSFSFSVLTNQDASRIVVAKNTEPTEYYGQAYFFSLEGPDDSPEYDFNSIDINENIDLKKLMTTIPVEDGGLGFDSALETAIASNQSISLIRDSGAYSDKYLTIKDYTISCGGHSLYLEGSIEVATGTMEIVKASKVDMSSLELYNDGKASDGQCVIIIRGENVKVTFPDTIKEGRDSAESGGFYWEKNSGSYLITYRE